MYRPCSLGRDLDQRAHVAVQLVLGAVVGVQGDGDRIPGGDHVSELSERLRPYDHVLDRLAGQVFRTAGGDLDDPVALGVSEALEGRVQRLARRDIDRRVGEALLLGPVEHLRVDLWRRDRHAVTPGFVGLQQNSNILDEAKLGARL
jgi:hypothetical protein